MGQLLDIPTWLAALPVFGKVTKSKGTPADDKTKKLAAQNKTPLSERDQNLVAIIAKMTSETMDVDRERLLTILMG